MFFKITCLLKPQCFSPFSLSQEEDTGMKTVLSAHLILALPASQATDTVLSSTRTVRMSPAKLKLLLELPSKWLKKKRTGYSCGKPLLTHWSPLMARGRSTLSVLPTTPSSSWQQMSAASQQLPTLLLVNTSSSEMERLWAHMKMTMTTAPQHCLG